MTDVAFWPTRQRAPQRRVLVIAVIALLVLLGWASQPRVIVDFRDLRCPDGYGAQPVSIAAWSCRPNTPDARWPQSQPMSRYVGLFLTRFDARVFDYDFGKIHGPGLNVRVR